MIKSENEIKETVGEVYSDTEMSYKQAASRIDALCWVLGVAAPNVRR